MPAGSDGGSPPHHGERARGGRAEWALDRRALGDFRRESHANKEADWGLETLLAARAGARVALEEAGARQLHMAVRRPQEPPAGPAPRGRSAWPALACTCQPEPSPFRGKAEAAGSVVLFFFLIDTGWGGGGVQKVQSTALKLLPRVAF